VSFDEQKIIKKKKKKLKTKVNATIGSQKENDGKLKLNKKHNYFFSNSGPIICDLTQILRFYSLDSKRNQC
jgi:hypothetical protein